MVRQLNIKGQIDVEYDVCKSFENTDFARNYETEKGYIVRGIRIARAKGELYFEDNKGYIHKLDESCLHPLDDAQIRAVCRDCGDSAYFKIRKKRGEVVGLTEKNRPFFNKKLEKQTKELESIINDSSIKKKSVRYVHTVGRNIENLNLIENKMVLIDKKEDTLHYMTGVLKKLDKEGEDIYVIIEVNNLLDGRFLVKGGLLEGGYDYTPKPIVISEDPIESFDLIANKLFEEAAIKA